MAKPSSARELTLLVQIRESSLTSYTQAQTQGSEVAHPKVYILYKRLGQVRGQSC